MPQQSLPEFVNAMEAAGLLVRIKDEVLLKISLGFTA